MIGFGFGELGLHRIWTDCVVENRASAHVLEKCGMSCEGRLRHLSHRAGAWRDHFVYAILEDEFRQAGGQR
jgi:ribosomal-protein-alanine N-acetyltransferase